MPSKKFIDGFSKNCFFKVTLVPGITHTEYLPSRERPSPPSQAILYSRPDIRVASDSDSPHDTTSSIFIHSGYSMTVFVGCLSLHRSITNKD